MKCNWCGTETDVDFAHGNVCEGVKQYWNKVRICTVCKEEKRESDFVVTRRSPSGKIITRDVYCRDCRTAVNRRYRRLHSSANPPISIAQEIFNAEQKLKEGTTA